MQRLCGKHLCMPILTSSSFSVRKYVICTFLCKFICLEIKISNYVRYLVLKLRNPYFKYYIKFIFQLLDGFIKKKSKVIILNVFNLHPSKNNTRLLQNRRK